MIIDGNKKVGEAVPFQTGREYSQNRTIQEMRKVLADAKNMLEKSRAKSSISTKLFNQFRDEVISDINDMLDRK